MKTESLREAYGRELLKMARADERIVALDADLSKSTKSCYLDENLPERFFEMGIAEQNMVSTAVGLALVGKIPFVNSFAVFATGRAYDQIRQGVALPRVNVKIVGSSAGLSDYGDGATHQAVEDMAIMRAIPNMTVIAPVDANQVRRVLKTIIEKEGPVYLRIPRNEFPFITDEQQTFEIGKIYQHSDGRDVAVFASGLMVSKALKVAGNLETKGISVKVLNVPTIKPLSRNEVERHLEGVRGIVTVEEHSVIGGLGSTINEALLNKNLPIQNIGIADKFGQSANDYEKLLEHYGLTEEAIIRAIKEVLEA